MHPRLVVAAAVLCALSLPAEAKARKKAPPKHPAAKAVVRSASGRPLTSRPLTQAASQAQVKRTCFGAIGANCMGVPPVAMAHQVPGGVRMAVAVGSILHDNCCLQHPNGLWCHGPKNLIGNRDFCEKEWRKAEADTIERRLWYYTFTGLPDDLTPVPGRPATLLDGSVVRNAETASSRKLSAPKGTNLDPGDQAFCASGRAKPKSFGPIKWIVCQ